VYDALPGKTWAEARHKRTKRLEPDSGSMLQIISYLRSQPFQKASEFLRFMRLTESLNLKDLMRYRTENGEFDRDAMSDSKPASYADLLIEGTEEFRIIAPPSIESKSAVTSILEQFLSDSLVHASAVSEASSAARSATVETVETAVEMFLNCSKSLFYIITDEQVAEHLDRLKKYRGELLLEVLEENIGSQFSAQFAEITGMAAIGVLLLRQSNTAPAVSTALADYLYAISRHLLDDVIEEDPLRAMKVCSLLAFYNILLRAAVAFAYTGTCY
jgi:hypothetical protein